MSAPVDVLDPTEERWVIGDSFDISIPADPESLLLGGAAFLTAAFRATGALEEDNSVIAVIDSAEFYDGGSGRKLQLRVAYERPSISLPERLFVKFSRHFSNKLWDSAKHMMLSEVSFAMLSRSPDFPVMVPRFMFGDVELASETGLLITELIPYGEGNVEPVHPKCMDYLIPNVVDHYKAIFRSLGRLSGAHRAGKLPQEFHEVFPDADAVAAKFRGQAPKEQLIQWANQMFDFIHRYPKLFPDDLHDPALRERFLAYMADVWAAGDQIQEILQSGYPHLVAFAHWNGNIDNCWFERNEQGELECGFIDWALCGQLPLARAISGALGCAESYVWADHLEDLLEVFVEAFASQGAPPMDREELSLHVRVSMAAGFSFSMAAPVAIARDIDDIDSVTGPRDPIFRDLYTSRVMLHNMTNMLENWQGLGLGELVRQLNSTSS